MTKFPLMKYSVIYADPPWTYDFSESKETGLEVQYETMSLDDIKSLPVQSISKKDCVLYMWTTAPKICEGLEVIDAWGFEYKTQIIWDKEITGMGYWALGQHEILMIGTKGNISPPDTSVRSSSIKRVKRGQHSSKPDHFRSLIDRHHPDVRKIELFYRHPGRDNGFMSLLPTLPEHWDVWGNESGADYE